MSVDMHLGVEKLRVQNNNLPADLAGGKGAEGVARNHQHWIGERACQEQEVIISHSFLLLKHDTLVG